MPDAYPRLASARILITGGHGFLGTHLRAALARTGCRKVLAPTSGELDLLHRDRVRDYVRAHAPSLVFHLAGRVGGIGHNQRRPADLFFDNLMMGVQLLEECRQAGVAKVVSVATVCAYPANTPVPFSEDALWDGYPEATNAPYGLAKKMLLVQSQAARTQYGFNSVVLLPANLYGPGDNFDLASGHVVPALIRKIDAARRDGAKTVTLWGDGTPTRELFYVDDCADALMLAAEKYDGSDPVNIGTGVDIAIRALAEKVAHLLDWQGELVFDTSKPNGQMKRRLDVTRARERFGFEARISLDEGLKRTIEWWQRRSQEEAAKS